MSLIQLFSKLPIDLGQSEYKHKTKGKQIAFSNIPKCSQESKALDVGCGDGYWSEKMQQIGYNVTSIDQERTYPNVDSSHRYENMAPTNLNSTLPYKDNSFDFVWCSEVIEHLTNYKQTIQEIERILKPNGTYIITTPNSFFWLHYLLKIFGISNKDWQNKGHINFFHLSDIKHIFPKAQVFGYFPYTFIKFTIKSGIGLLSPTFVIAGKKQ